MLDCHLLPGELHVTGTQPHSEQSGVSVDSDALVRSPLTTVQQDESLPHISRTRETVKPRMHGVSTKNDEVEHTYVMQSFLLYMRPWIQTCVLHMWSWVMALSWVTRMFRVL